MNKKKVDSILKGVAAAGLAIGGVSSITGPDVVMAATISEEQELDKTENDVISDRVSDTPSESRNERQSETSENSANTQSMGKVQLSQSEISVAAMFDTNGTSPNGAGDVSNEDISNGENADAENKQDEGKKEDANNVNDGIGSQIDSVVGKRINWYPDRHLQARV